MANPPTANPSPTRARARALTDVPAAASPAKRKAAAALYDFDDAENVDPILFAKRSKGIAASPLKKPASLTLTVSAPVAATPPARPLPAPRHSSAPRPTLHPKSPAARINAARAAAAVRSTPPPAAAAALSSAPASAPAGRSPTRVAARRSAASGPGSISRRRTGPLYSSVEPPSSLAHGRAARAADAPFSLDAALRGTLSGHVPAPSRAAPKPSPSSPSLAARAARCLDALDNKAGWFFDIHEDTPEQEMTNLLQHSTCVLDISSDEESERKARRERDEGRNKENVPPPDDVTQPMPRAAARARARAAGPDDMAVEKPRVALGEMNAVDFYPAGCDGRSVVLVDDDDDDDELPVRIPAAALRAPTSRLALTAGRLEPELELAVGDESGEQDAPGESGEQDASEDESNEHNAPGEHDAPPLDDTGDSFELWESGSATDDAEP